MLLFGDVLRGGMRVFRDPDDVPGGGEPTPPPANDEKKFSQKDLDDAITKRLKKVKEEIRLKDDTVAKLTSRLDELEAAHNKGTSEAEKGTWEVAEKKLRAEIDSLKIENDRNKKEAAKAKEEKAISERDTELRSLLREAGAVDPDKAAFRFIQPDLVYDTEDEEWVIKMASGGTAKITKDVLADILPDNMKSSEMRGGGSGSHAAGAKRKQKESDIAREQKKFDELDAKCTAHPQNNSLFVERKKQRLLLEELRRNLNT